jgi:hypothetical protein
LKVILGASAAGAGVAGAILLVVSIVGVYLIPTWVALIRHHTQKGAIFAINLFLGWTLLGWVGSLAWACSTSKYMPSHPAQARRWGSPTGQSWPPPQGPPAQPKIWYDQEQGKWREGQ